MNQKELDNIINQHLLWLKGDSDGVRADLRFKDLRGLNLKGKCLVQANLGSVDMTGMDLERTDFDYANLYRAKMNDTCLNGTKFNFANMENCDLRDASMKRSELRGCNLRHANLNRVNLKGSDIRHVVGNNSEIKTLLIGVYDIVYTTESMAIGCKQYPINNWFNFDDDFISKLSPIALCFWKEYKEIIKTVVTKSPAFKC